MAVVSGLGAAHVAARARDSNHFSVTINIEPETKAAFYLTYEELLQLNDGRYEQVINLHPRQPVKDLSVEVLISESRKIINLRAPPLRSGNEIINNDQVDLDPRADLEIIDDKSAIVKFSPSLERQKRLARLLGKKEEEGLSGQFVVQYNVERDPQGGEVLIQDGYFVHFFAPLKLAPLSKYVVFVLDTSYSMWGQKLEQLKQAMVKILEQLHDNDLFSLVEFNTNVRVWDLNDVYSSIWYPSDIEGYSYSRDEVGFENFTFPNAFLASSDNIIKAKGAIAKLGPTGATDVYTALRVGFHLVELEKNQKIDNINRQPIIVFLTDGEPTVRLTSTEGITNKISAFNDGPRRSPIFAISFGISANRDFLQKVALSNFGFSKHIYDAIDAALQLRDFYRHISSPLLANVTFKYEPSITSLTKTEFPIHFDGSELVVSGKYSTSDVASPVIDGWGEKGRMTFKSAKIEQSVSNVERLWAYLQIKQLLEDIEASEGDIEETKKKALHLALKYSFVTPVSSLVVVKPNATDSVDIETVSEGGFTYSQNQPGYTTTRPPFTTKSTAYSYVPRPFLPYFPPPSAAGYFPPPEVAGDDFLTLQQTLPFTTKSTTYPPFTTKFTTYPPFTTPATLPHIVPTTEEQPVSLVHLLTILPWLKDILKDGMLDITLGKYKLGLNETIADKVDCFNTPINGTGYCSLLHLCPQVHPLLINSDVFLQHGCILKNEFAGICCPNIKYIWTYKNSTDIHTSYIIE